MGYNEDYSRMAKDVRDAGDPKAVLMPPNHKAVMLSPSSVDTYKGVLQATQDVFGEENMTVDVMIEAIRVGGSITLLKDERSRNE